MNKSLFEYVTECNNKGVMPKGLTSPFERTEVMYRYNEIVRFGIAYTVVQNVKVFFEKFGYPVEWINGYYKIRKIA